MADQLTQVAAANVQVAAGQAAVRVGDHGGGRLGHPGAGEQVGVVRHREVVVADGLPGLRAEASRPLWEYFPDGVLPSGCPSRVVLDHVTSKWGVLVLVALSGETLRWGELRRRAEGISEKMLAQTLRTLERDGLVHREAQPVIPPRGDYSLTARGRELAALLLPLVEWTVANADEILGS